MCINKMNLVNAAELIMTVQTLVEGTTQVPNPRLFRIYISSDPRIKSFKTFYFPKLFYYLESNAFFSLYSSCVKPVLAKPHVDAVDLLTGK